MTTVRLLVDRNIPFAREVFSQFGEVRVASGREINRQMVQEADILLVRSVTRVGPSLLNESPVRFVGTATIGTDHIDLDYLRRHGIQFADAAGSNAISVAEYVSAALMYIEGKLGTDFTGRTLGVVGVGNVGSRVQKLASALGLKILLNDPPRAEKEGAARFVSLETLLQTADIISFHTPLTKQTLHPTYHLIGERELGIIKEGAVLMNTSRGAVVDNGALLRALDRNRLGAVVLDVWEGEPDPHIQLLRRVTLGTPHIAGYSFDGKIAGARMMAEAVSRFLGAPFHWPETLGPEDLIPLIMDLGHGREAIRRVILSAYPIAEDDRRMRHLLSLPAEDRPKAFDSLRKDYPIRREFRNFTVKTENLSAEDGNMLRALGFKVTSR